MSAAWRAQLLQLDNGLLLRQADVYRWGIGGSYTDGAVGMLTAEMTSGTPFDGWETEIWDFTAGLYPRLRGMETIDAACVSASPVFLAGTETVAEVSSNFTLGGTNIGVAWTSSNPEVVSIDEDSATIKDSGSVTLTATRGDASKSVKLVCSFIPVEEITDVPDTATAGTPLELTRTVVPNNATNQTITWSVLYDDGTSASIEGNILYATAAGTVTVLATIANGLAVGTNYTQDFDIAVNRKCKLFCVNGFVP